MPIDDHACKLAFFVRLAVVLTTGVLVPTSLLISRRAIVSSVFPLIFVGRLCAPLPRTANALYQREPSPSRAGFRHAASP